MLVARIYGIALLLTLFNPTAAHAAADDDSTAIIIQSPADYAGTPWTKLNIPAGTKLFIKRTESGKTLHRLEFVGGVTLSEQENGSTLGMDNNNGGGIMCVWGIYATLKNTMDKCYPEETELRQNFDLAIEKLEKFIIANNLTPVTKSDLDNDLQKQGARQSNICGGETSKMAKTMIAKKAELMKTLQKSLDESLAIPRPPVLNPCM